MFPHFATPQIQASMHFRGGGGSMSDQHKGVHNIEVERKSVKRKKKCFKV